MAVLPQHYLRSSSVVRLSIPALPSSHRWISLNHRPMAVVVPHNHRRSAKIDSKKPAAAMVDHPSAIFLSWFHEPMLLQFHQVTEAPNLHETTLMDLPMAIAIIATVQNYSISIPFPVSAPQWRLKPLLNHPWI